MGQQFSCRTSFPRAFRARKRTTRTQEELCFTQFQSGASSDSRFSFSLFSQQPRPSLKPASPPSEIDAQGRITYTATVTNSGADNANNLVVTFTMPNIFLPISSNPSSCVFKYNGPLFATCSLGTLPSGASATATVVIYPTNTGNLFVNMDAAESGATASTQVGSTVTAVGIADVAVFLDTNPNPAQVGSPLTYSVTAFNIGDDDAGMWS